MRLTLLFLTFSFIVLIFPLYGQPVFNVSGKVLDINTKEPLAFVNIIINDDPRTGGITDIDGKFHLQYIRKIRSLTLSYVGYKPLTYILTDRYRNLLICMTQTDIELKEVEILPGINPAHRIIRNAVENREMNDPEKLKSFSYTSYDKTIFTIDADTTLTKGFPPDSIPLLKNGGDISFKFTAPHGKNDSILNDSTRMDSMDNFLSKLIRRQYLFLMENVTKRKFLHPDKNYNQVIATKMSGFKDPIFVFLTTQIQSFSFYKPFITIFQKTYVNPISSGTLNKYFFKIEDTTWSRKDTTYIIQFRPRKGTNFDGLKGVISINTNKWAIQNVIAQPYQTSDGFNVRIQQMYEMIDTTWWFPVQLNTDVEFNNMRIGKYRAIGRGKSYIRDIVLNPELVRKEFNHLDIEVDKEATTRKEKFWNQYRTDSLSKKDQQTYKVLDSIGNANNFDKLAKSFQTIISGRIPWKIIDFDLSRVVNYNTYEGVVLGLGLHTNDQLLDWVKAGGFFQFSFAISNLKYGGDVRFLLNRRNDVSFQAVYFLDRVESGGVNFFDGSDPVLTGNWRDLLIKKLDYTRIAGGSFTFRLRKYLLLNAGYSNSYKKSTTYDFVNHRNDVTLLFNDFHFNEINAGLKWAYDEKFIQTVDNKISLGTNYPTVWLQYTRGIKSIPDGQFDYTRIDLKIKKTFRIKFGGKLSLQFNAGYIDSPVPACNLYYGNGSYRLVTIFCPNTFSTMRMNEFLSNKYFSLYLYHDFGNLLFKGKSWFHPEFALSQNVGFGWLDHPDRYSELIVRPMNLGFYETGLLINNLVNLKLYMIGIGAFYRWGPYSFDYYGNNMAFKLSIMFPF